MENRKQPDIRFSGFEKDWEETSIGKISNVIDPHPSHRAPIAVNEGIPFIGIGDVNEVGNINYKNVRVVDEKIYDEHHSRYDLSIPSIGIGRVASLGKVIRLRNDIGKYAVSPTMSVIQFNEEYDLDFLYSFMNSPEFQNQFKSYSNGSTRQSVGIQDLRKLILNLPCSNDEQKKIGRIFKDIDNFIISHQQELATLKQTKQGFLQKMFPKEGEKVPEVRFPGFTDDWEQYKLGDLTESFDNQRVPIDSGLRVSGRYPYYGATGIIDYVDDYIFDGEYVLLAEDGANIIMRNYPVVYLTQGKFWLNNHAHIMKMTNGDNQFLAQVLEKIDYVKYNTGTAQPKLNGKIVKKIELRVPITEEQKKIGTFFKQFDETIALHQRELELLQLTKKAFLQKLFV